MSFSYFKILYKWGEKIDISYDRSSVRSSVEVKWTHELSPAVLIILTPEFRSKIQKSHIYKKNY